MCVVFLLCLVNFVCLFTVPVHSQDSFFQLTSSSITVTELEKAVFLERVKGEIDFCLENLGKSFEEVDADKIGITWGYGSWGTNAISYGLIAFKYGEYGDTYTEADYYYKDYLCEKSPEKYWKSKYNWPGYPGDVVPFSNFMDRLKNNREYGKTLKFYPEYFDYYFLSRLPGTKKEKRRRLMEELKNDSDAAKLYKDFMGEWNATRKLAADRTIKPKSLHPAVQNHEWFYRNNRGEVLKALDYYYQNKVKFMLEKALAHKDKAVRAKASEYLKKLEPEPAK